jgi:hypothetical protein
MEPFEAGGRAVDMVVDSRAAAVTDINRVYIDLGDFADEPETIGWAFGGMIRHAIDILGHDPVGVWYCQKDPNGRDLVVCRDASGNARQEQST